MNARSSVLLTAAMAALLLIGVSTASTYTVRTAGSSSFLFSIWSSIVGFFQDIWNSIAGIGHSSTTTTSTVRTSSVSSSTSTAKTSLQTSSATTTAHANGSTTIPATTFVTTKSTTTSAASTSTTTINASTNSTLSTTSTTSLATTALSTTTVPPPGFGNGFYLTETQSEELIATGGTYTASILPQSVVQNLPKQYNLTNVSILSYMVSSPADANLSEYVIETTDPTETYHGSIQMYNASFNLTQLEKPKGNSNVSVHFNDTIDGMTYSYSIYWSKPKKGTHLIQNIFMLGTKDGVFTDTYVQDKIDNVSVVALANNVSAQIP